MNTSSLRRILPAGAAGTAMLAAPACAAVCPKGIGNCPYPGRCLMYTDADGNRLCDFTATDAGSPAGEVAASAGDGTSAAGTTLDGLSSSSPDAGSTGAADIILASPALLWAVLFVIINIALLWAVRSGRTGLPANLDVGTVALTSLVALPVSGCLALLLSGDVMLGSTGAIVYMLAGTVLAAVVWTRGLMTKKTTLLLLGATTAFGFVFAAPLMPVYFYGFVATLTGIQVLGLGMAAILLLVLLTFFTGRAFCAHICPVGTLQELASRLPGRKFRVNNRIVPQAVRLVVLAAAVAGVFVSVNLLAATGVESFFSLALTAGTLVFAAILVVSIVVYRPLCRFLCPFGAVFSACAAVGTTGIVRTDACIGCRKCEKVCPTGEAAPDTRNAECYLCGRCTEVCPVEGALVFSDPFAGEKKI
ncbi:hypothetical protein AZH53_07535 [Methanomicrobiaceae archaeon CYW5]|uniref:4Fe-4S binding protein n=1 Tax=Methanovulcanius yangii TaxID=1789227 RepID=UPI0029CA8FFA|nr:4Fe-4S binding protein [Methanovulcanius yangii]MBT8508254.1 hypothetical protein [Methanovulcanius yangii]